MNNLKHYRKAAGLTQPELAERVGISHRTLQDYEQGRKPLEKAAAITVLTMARILGCSVADLIDPQPAETE
jgi:transcriptional regulator with XRE-family HTH domain